MNNYNKKSKKNSKNNANYFVLPLIIIVGVIPLIMRYKEFNSNTSQFVWDSLNDLKSDTSTYYKSLFYTLLSITMLCIIVAKNIKLKYKFKENIKYNRLFMLLGLYALLSVLSTILSKYKYFSIHGMMYHFETIFVLLGYCITVYYCYLFIKSKRDIKTFVIGISIFVAIMGMLGISQFINKDFLTSGLGRKLILPLKYIDKGGVITNTTFYKNVSLSLYNPNYVGLYVSIMIPFFAVILAFKSISVIKNIKEITRLEYKGKVIDSLNCSRTNRKGLTKNVIELILYIFILFSMILSLIGCNSSSGIIAVLVSTILLLFIIIMHNEKKKIIMFGIIGVIVVAFGINFNNLRNYITQQLTIYDKPISLEEIQTNKDNVCIKYKDNTIKVSYDYNKSDGAFKIHFIDNNNNVLDDKYDENTKSLNDNRFSNLQFIPTLYNNEIVSLGIIIDGTQWNFTNQLEDGSYYYLNMMGRPDKIVKPESILFNGLETLGSFRGFIWSRTIPLLKNNIILGSGPDTFVIEYPQNDYVGLYNYVSNQLIDKPHNMYLQIGVQTGVLSLIILIIFWSIYILWSLKLYIKVNYTDYRAQVGLASLLGVVGFLVSAMMNDSTINVTPVFWAIIGLGIAMNLQIEKDLIDSKA